MNEGVLLSDETAARREKFVEKLNVENEQDLKLAVQALSASLDGVLVLDRNGFIIYCNDSILTLYGAKEENEMMGKHILNFVTEQDKPQIILNSKECAKGKRWSGQYTAVAKDGSLVPIEISVTPLKNSYGEIIGAIDIVRDVTVCVKMQREIEDANQKLRVVCDLIRHDISNALSLLSLKCYLAKKTGHISALAEDTEKTVAKIQNILSFSRDYEHAGTEQLHFINVADVFNEAVKYVPGLENIKIKSSCEDLYVYADSLLQKLFGNLLNNTKKYGVKTTSINLSYKEEANNLTLIYEDDGVGIPSKDKQNIFAKGFGYGTGLGLYLIKKIMAVYNWQIHETGIEGQGVKFVLTIPKDKYNLSSQQRLNNAA